MIQKGNSNPLSVSDEHLISHYNRAIARFFKLEGGGGGIIMSSKGTSLVLLGVKFLLQKIFKFGGSETPYSNPGFYSLLD